MSEAYQSAVANGSAIGAQKNNCLYSTVAGGVSPTLGDSSSKVLLASLAALCGTKVIPIGAAIGLSAATRRPARSLHTALRFTLIPPVRTIIQRLRSRGTWRRLWRRRSRCPSWWFGAERSRRLSRQDSPRSIAFVRVVQAALRGSRSLSRNDGRRPRSRSRSSWSRWRAMIGRSDRRGEPGRRARRGGCERRSGSRPHSPSPSSSCLSMYSALSWPPHLSRDLLRRAVAYRILMPLRTGRPRPFRRRRTS